MTSLPLSSEQLDRIDAGEFASEHVDEMFAALISQARAAITLERERDGWERTAADFATSSDFYRDLVREIGKPFGVAAYTSDDGNIQDEVLALKVPELVAALRAERDALHARVEAAERERELARADQQAANAAGLMATAEAAAMREALAETMGALEPLLHGLRATNDPLTMRCTNAVGDARRALSSDAGRLMLAVYEAAKRQEQSHYAVGGGNRTLLNGTCACEVCAAVRAAEQGKP